MDFTFNPCLSVPTPPVPTLSPVEPTLEHRLFKDEEEVFHISNQDYTYNQAKCKCGAYGARLATKDEIVKAYNGGAEWCSYGWSDGQNAFYPTQQCTLDEKARKGKDNNCGKAGVNGGFFSNPDLRFGTNCYGVRPKGEIVNEKEAICQGQDFCRMPNNSRSANKLDSDHIAPFNKNQWTQYVQ